MYSSYSIPVWSGFPDVKGTRDRPAYPHISRNARAAA